MNNGKNVVIIRPTDNTADRIRAIQYYKQCDYVMARNLHESLEFKAIKVRLNYMRITLLFTLVNYFKDCDFIEVL